jgi:SSS family solute:Na+ symporter
VTKQGAFAGIVAGVAVVAYTTLTHASIGLWFPSLPEKLKDLNIGLVALALNIVVLVVVSAVTQPRAAEHSHARTL